MPRRRLLICPLPVGFWAVCLVVLASSTTAQAQHYAFIQGRWFTGQAFEEKAFFAVNGRLTETRPARIDSVIDLRGGYVVPPYGEAHTHLLGTQDHLDEEIQMFLRDGVFYVMNQDPIAELTLDVRAQVNRPESVDVAYTEGVVAPSWSIVARLYEALAQEGRFGPGTTLDDLDTRTVFLIDDREDLETKWKQLAERNERFIKIILAFSEEHERRVDNPAYGFELGAYSALPGLDPALLPTLIERAHAAGLRVSVHVETAADFHVAVTAGADLIAHLPASWQIGATTGFDGDRLAPWLIAEEDARRAAQQGTVVITTALPPPAHPDSARFAEVHRRNLALLERHGVALALGSDRFDATSLAEARYLAALGAFDNRQILRLLATATPQAIFPERKLGALAEGYEASFLVLEANPLDDLRHLSRITTRVKQGRLLHLAPSR